MMFPTVSEIIRQNDMTPFCVTLYGMRLKAPEVAAIAKETEAVYRVTYYNFTTGRKNVTLRYYSEEKRDSTLDRIDDLGLRYRVHNDRESLQ